MCIALSPQAINAEDLLKLIVGAHCRHVVPIALLFCSARRIALVSRKHHHSDNDGGKQEGEQASRYVQVTPAAGAIAALLLLLSFGLLLQRTDRQCNGSESRLCDADKLTLLLPTAGALSLSDPEDDAEDELWLLESPFSGSETAPLLWPESLPERDVERLADDELELRRNRG